MLLKPTYLKQISVALSFGAVLGACGQDEMIPAGGALDSGMESPEPSTSSVPSSRPSTTAAPTATVPTSMSPGSVGRACDTDANCADGLFCMTSASDEWFGGGPANGYCTLSCASNPDICPQMDSAAACLTFTSGAAYCMQACLAGDTNSKCHDRGDVACDASVSSDVSATPLGYCRPTCRGDQDCDGRQCDLGSGACVDSVEGDPVGSQCVPGTAREESNCASKVCLGSTATGYGTCSGICNLSTFGCGSDPDAPGAAGSGICLIPAVGDLSGRSDLGLCTQLCACDGDCSHPDALCLVLPEENQDAVGFTGVCVAPRSPDDMSAPPPAGFTLGKACPISEAGVADAAVSEAGVTDAQVPDAAQSLPDAEASTTDAQSAPVDAASAPISDSSVVADASGDQ